jgi:hypothetical protein
MGASTRVSFKEVILGTVIQMRKLHFWQIDFFFILANFLHMIGVSGK